MTAIAGIDDRNIQTGIEMSRTTGPGRSNHDRLRTHGDHVLRRIEQGFSLARTGSPSREGDRSVAKPMYSGLEASSGPG